MAENMFENTEWMHGILESCATGLWRIMIDSNTGINSMYASQSMLTLLGLEEHPSPEECYQHWWSNIDDAYKDYIKNAVEQIIETRKWSEVQYVWNHPLFGRNFVRCGGMLEKSIDGIHEIRGTHQNITEVEFFKAEHEMSVEEKIIAAKIDSLEAERKRLEEQAMAFRGFLRNSLRNTNSFEVYYYPKERRLIIPDEVCKKYNVNSTYTNMPYGFSEEYVDPEFREEHEGMYESMHDGADTAFCEYSMWNGKNWFRTDLSISRRDEEGNPYVVVGIVEDITEIRLQQKENELLQRIANFTVNNDYESLTIVDLETMQYSIRDANNWMDSSFTDNNMIPRDERERLGKVIIEEDMGNLSIKRIISELKKRNNAFYSVIYTAINGEHKEARCGWFEKDKKVLITVRNVEERWQQEEESKRKILDALKAAEVANQAKSDFLSRMSHDLRTPLNAIVGMTAIAEKYSYDTGKVLECLDSIANSSDYLCLLVNNVLDMAKIENNKLELGEENFELDEFLTKMLDIVKPLIDSKKHCLEVINQGIEHGRVKGDKVRLQQLLLNILSNAVKYTDYGGKIDFVVKELPCEKEGFGLYQFNVKDNGMGMEESFLPNLFNAFERADNERIGGVEGTGLGMPIAKRIANMMGGDITIESKLNVGSNFTITVYLKLQDELQESDTTVQKEKRIPNYKGKNILLVEDNLINSEIAQEILFVTGADIEVVVNGKEAVEKVQQAEENYYSLIFMDVRMPIMNGYEAVEVIRGLERQDAKNIPIIAMTADAYAEDVAKAKASGMNDHIAKPIDIDKLYKILRKWE